MPSPMGRILVALVGSKRRFEYHTSHNLLLVHPMLIYQQLLEMRVH
jgi:hypothetical protein